MAIDLPGLAAFVDRQLPATLHRNEYGRTCVEPERVCTKVPEIRGFEVTMKNRCAEVSPRIDCTVTETVRREGPIRISGEGGQIVLMQDVFGSATVRGRGEIGQHIRQTVRARAEITILASPRIDPDWHPEVAVSISYRWLERPEFRLFNLIPITLGKTLGPPLDQAIREFEADGLGEELDKLDLRSETETLWTTIQAPQVLALPGDEALFLHLRPYAVGFEGPSFDGGAIRARLDLALRPEISDTREGAERLPLPDLSALPDAGLALHVPVRVTTETLNAAVGAWLPATIQLEEEDGTRVVIHEAVTAIDGDTLTVDVIVDAEGDLLSFENEAIQIAATPSLNETTGSLVFSDIRLASGDEGLAGRAKTLMLRAAGIFMAETYSIALQDELSALEKTLDRALNRDLTPEFRLAGGGNMRARDLRLLPEVSALEATISSTGHVRVIGFDPTRVE